MGYPIEYPDATNLSLEVRRNRQFPATILPFACCMYVCDARFVNLDRDHMWVSTNGTILNKLLAITFTQIQHQLNLFAAMIANKRRDVRMRFVVHSFKI